MAGHEDDEGGASDTLPSCPERKETTTDDNLLNTLLKLASDSDVQRFGDIPYADYDFWCRKFIWGADQAIALSLCKEPIAINWETICRENPDIVLSPRHITDYAKFSRFALIYHARYDLLLNHIAFGNIGFIKDNIAWIRPVEFVDWVRRYEIDVPTALIVSVQKFHENLIDWEEEAFRLKQENERLQFDLEKLKASTDEPHPKSRSTFQKMVLGMARSQYKWGDDCSAVGKIKKAVENLGEGITISDDAVRGALKDAAAALDVQIEKAP